MHIWADLLSVFIGMPGDPSLFRTERDYLRDPRGSQYTRGAVKHGAGEREREMERALTRVKFEGLEEEDSEGTSASEMGSEGEVSEGEEEEERREARLLVSQQNRKGKKSGGFQSMGEELSLSVTFLSR